MRKFTSCLLIILFSNTTSAMASNNAENEWFTADVTGDRYEDVIRVTRENHTLSATVYAAINHNEDLATPMTWLAHERIDATLVFFDDIDRDNRDDLIVANQTQHDMQWIACHSDGRAFHHCTEWARFDRSNENRIVLIGDVTNDHRADIIQAIPQSKHNAKHRDNDPGEELEWIVYDPVTKRTQLLLTMWGCSCCRHIFMYDRQSHEPILLQIHTENERIFRWEIALHSPIVHTRATVATR